MIAPVWALEAVAGYLMQGSSSALAATQRPLLLRDSMKGYKQVICVQKHERTHVEVAFPSGCGRITYVGGAGQPMG